MFISFTDDGKLRIILLYKELAGKPQKDILTAINNYFKKRDVDIVVGDSDTVEGDCGLRAFEIILQGKTT